MAPTRFSRSPSDAPRCARWPRGPAEPRLRDGALHVWAADLDALAGEHDEHLSEQESANLEAIIGEPRRRRRGSARGLLRELLGRYLSRSPGELCLTTGDRGKPSLAFDGGPFFNLAHSGRFAVVAVSAQGDVGVDLEVVRELRVDVGALATRTLAAPAAERVRGAPERVRTREFLREWTRHEARVKCLGSGLEIPPGASAEALWTAELDLGDALAGAVACTRRPSVLRLWQWPPEGP